MADALDLGSNGATRAGSSPVPRTTLFICFQLLFLELRFLL